MTRVDSVEFVALTGTGLAAASITAILEAADREVDNAILAMGSPALPTNTLNDAALLFAKALLTDRYRFDGTFDASTTDYSHKGNTEAMISGYREQATVLMQNEADKQIIWIQKANR